MWLTIRPFLLSIVLPIAIDILTTLAESIGPKVKEALTHFFQLQYDETVVSGDVVWQSIIVAIIVPIFGLTIILAPEGPGVLTPGEIVSLHREMVVVGANKVRAKYDTENANKFRNPTPDPLDDPNHPSNQDGGG